MWPEAFYAEMEIQWHEEAEWAGAEAEAVAEQNYLKSYTMKIDEKDLDLLQRYEATSYPWIDWYYIEEYDKWEYVRWENLLELLK